MSDYIIDDRNRLKILAERLRSVLISHDVPDKATIDELERLTKVHSLYLQLMSVLLLLDQMDSLVEMNSSLKDMIDSYSEDLEYLRPAEKAKAIASVSRGFGAIYEAIQRMGVGQEGHKKLVSALRELIRGISSAEETDDKGLAQILASLDPDEKAKLIASLEQIMQETSGA